MGLLTNLIDAELTKKRDERVAKLNAYAAMLGQPDDKVAPEKKNQYLQLLTGEAPKGGKDLLQMMGPHLLKMGGKSKAQQTAQQSQQSPGDADLVSPDPNAPNKPAASEGTASGPFRSTEEQEAMKDREEKRKNALEIEKSTREYEAKARVDIQTKSLQRQENIKFLQELQNRTDLTDDQKQRLATEVGTQPAGAGTWTSGWLVTANGQKIPGSINKSNPLVLKVANGQPGGQDIVAPPGARIVSAEEYEKENKPPTEAAQKDAEIFGNYKEKHDIKDRDLTNSEKIQARADASAEEKAKTQNKDDRAIAIYAKPIAQRTPEEKDYLKGYEEFTKKTKTDPGVMRAQIYLQGRELPSVDTQNGSLTYATPKDIAANPGRFAPASQATAAMGKQAVFQDLHYNIDTARKAITALDSMDTKTRVALSYALRHTDPASALQTFMTGEAMTALTPQQQEAVQALALLSENAMSLRSVSGMGAGSDELRAAIQATLPSGKSPSKGYALEQLNKFESVVNRLQTGVPRLGNQLPGAGGGSASAGSVRYKSGAKTYSIPAGQVQDFLKDHPQAVKQ